jgi:hypothetical protein
LISGRSTSSPDCALADWQASQNALYQLATLNQLAALTIGARLTVADG